MLDSITSSWASGRGVSGGNFSPSQSSSGRSTRSASASASNSSSKPPLTKPMVFPMSMLGSASGNTNTSGGGSTSTSAPPPSPPPQSHIGDKELVDAINSLLLYRYIQRSLHFEGRRLRNNSFPPTLTVTPPTSNTHIPLRSSLFARTISFAYPSASPNAKQYQPTHRLHSREQLHTTPRSSNLANMRHSIFNVLASAVRFSRISHRSCGVYGVGHRRGSHSIKEQICHGRCSSCSGRRVPFLRGQQWYG